jgi:hypothetical protein
MKSLEINLYPGLLVRDLAGAAQKKLFPARLNPQESSIYQEKSQMDMMKEKWLKAFLVHA